MAEPGRQHVTDTNRPAAYGLIMTTHPIGTAPLTDPDEPALWAAADRHLVRYGGRFTPEMIAGSRTSGRLNFT